MTWRCVAATGPALADHASDADRELIVTFGLLHVTRRENEHVDVGHGARAAAHARELAPNGALDLAEQGLRFSARRWSATPTASSAPTRRSPPAGMPTASIFRASGSSSTATLVCTPQLLDGVDCKSVEQMKLVSAVGSFVELAGGV